MTESTPVSGPGPLDSTAQTASRTTGRPGSRPARLPRPYAPIRRPPALVVVAHGSRDPRALRTVRALLAEVRAQRPGVPVALGHIELNEPLLGDTLARLNGEAVLVPLLFGRGFHVKEDLPGALARAPHLRARVAPPLGPHPLLAQALHARLAEAGWRPLPAGRRGPAGGGRARGGAVVLASAGSRDPQSADDVRGIAHLLASRLGVPVVPARAAASPSVPEAVADLTARGHDRIAVASCFIAPGRFSARCAAAAPPGAVVSAPLGDHPAMARLVLHRYDSLAAGPATDRAAGPAAAPPHDAPAPCG
ncbi:sirohydrochlorin chelatase [Streptomyces sp. NPDC059637]|uniref:sirohydrochlorin chelatase n=1 Tax=Streptomyces sp. NPDC059637 TaxID=3347752 RepID=UPI00367EFE7F